MSTIEVNNVVSYQIGVDILGFPVYLEHLFATEHKTEEITKKQGKNMSKNHKEHHETEYIFAYIVKQF